MICPTCKIEFQILYNRKKYCSRPCAILAARRYDKKTTDKGYIYIKSFDHPRAYRGRWIGEHTVIMEQRLGRSIRPDEVVHHINGIKSDNRIENLKIMTRSEHFREHYRETLGKLVKYSDEFVQSSVALGRSIGPKKAASQLGISFNTLSGWMYTKRRNSPLNKEGHE